ncbi:serine/threonine protein kinase [Fusobacterium nucleatum YWH7199]|uniref:serine/threonine protein kinase n=1 Tax=Fusobacterium TaxID=848 RepID=UPI00201AF06F|nr:serine/threonine protein kinase [Fusobacterium nucleatum]MCL4575561.1 serine/threonine protein kinase [Fusobacterium nucleatum YWH7056]MCL4581512.1 serine/threonine protein kinase [Fusobacterium nucleatum YWH7199]MCL4583465.1 serine/threonine protein kinase [Fusobacterium nucleatum YWH7054]MCL4591269.1 serine/threonine protein kinase [Fusobacterium nucleatum YWH7053]
MKKLLSKIVLFIILSLTAFSYNFPIDDPYSATIIGSATMMTPGVSENIPLKVYEIQIKDKKDIPDVFLYASKFKFSFSKQKNKKAPLIFVLAGTGSDYNTTRVKFMQRIFHDAGYHTIAISSQMSQQFMISASSNSVPGLLLEDNKDIYKAMKLAYNKIKDQVEVTDFYIMGYSLGGSNAAVLSYIDEKEKVFNFKRVFMVNPPVNLYNSAVKLDKYLDDYTGGKTESIEKLLNTTLAKVKGGLTSEYANIGADTIYNIVKGDILSDAEKEAYIGLAFRLASTDLNFISDFMTRSHVYTKNPEKVDKYTNMKEYFKAVNFATFEDYVNKIGFPYYKKHNKDYSIEDLKREASLKVIEDYLRTSPKIAAVTNADELILNEKDFAFLKDVFKDRLVIYPKGGHCGNMFYKENVDVMLKFLNEGVLKYEN